MENQSALGIIAGNGIYPFLIAERRGRAALPRFTSPRLRMKHGRNWQITLIRSSGCGLGQLSRLLKYFEKAGVRQAIMAGQIAPKKFV